MRLKFPMPFSSVMRQQKKWQKALSKIMEPTTAPAKARPRQTRPSGARLHEVVAFGANPGGLRMLEYVPPQLKAGAPLVVVLHGCLQNAVDFDRGSGWSRLAKEMGFALLYPEQRPNNNSNLCFNWFRPSSVARDRGELMSIRQMIDNLSQRHKISPDRIFVMGLSAGGAMTSALLAVYPDLFAGGAIIAGLPYGAARDAMSAMSVMKSGANRSAREWGDLVRSATPDIRSLPKISIWHGMADRVVNVTNAHASLHQWLDLHGLPEEAAREEMDGSRLTRTWLAPDGDVAIELHLVHGMDHGLAVSPLAGRQPHRESVPFMLEQGICTPTELAASWGLAQGRVIRKRNGVGRAGL
ncbi:PHB depolymerase family esterase [Agrobacterium sp. a22-2]|uniref:extracellular catalytic domain type 1 short-chain-length polyhydroxyalkanoate depolymerase n=1 Tax=Agrobacterium sp. a22-2 TaxID=2283840 RepID=UPI0014453624|nr:PHB depolymerase family esterase [Agrobacterium sp. a22-2]NKN38095.1 PHB depolymerase family esterase [Agrobacterium sp. a22-2]